jgi:hypothetical protein
MTFKEVPAFLEHKDEGKMLGTTCPVTQHHTQISLAPTGYTFNQGSSCCCKMLGPNGQKTEWEVKRKTCPCPHHAGTHVAPFIHRSGTVSTWVVYFTPQRLCPWERTLIPPEFTAEQAGPDISGEEKSVLSLEIWNVDTWSRSPVAVLNMLHQLCRMGEHRLN